MSSKPPEARFPETVRLIHGPVHREVPAAAAPGGHIMPSDRQPAVTRFHGHPVLRTPCVGTHIQATTSRQQASMHRPHLKTPATVTALGLAAVCTVVLTAAGVPAGPSVAVGAVLGALPVWLFARKAAVLVRRSIGGRPATVGEFPRLHNVVEGLCLTNGIDTPDLYVLDSPSGNAAVVGNRRTASIIVTTGATDMLALVELEALLAHALVRCRGGRLADETLGALFARVFGARLVQARFGDSDCHVRADLAAAELTRYPPGMQRALQSLAELGTAVDAASPADAHLWLLQPDGAVDSATAVHPNVEMRVAALGEL